MIHMLTSHKPPQSPLIAKHWKLIILVWLIADKYVLGFCELYVIWCFQIWFVVLLVASWAFNGSANAGHVQNIIGLAPNR